jgi:hypothetical protein
MALSPVPALPSGVHALAHLTERFPDLRKAEFRDGAPGADSPPLVEGLAARCPGVHDGGLEATFHAMQTADGLWRLTPCDLGCSPAEIWLCAKLDARTPGEDDDNPKPIAKERNRFVLAHTQLSVQDLTHDPPPLEFILRPYIPAEMVSVLSGPGGSNKTTLTASLAVCRALGRHLFHNLYPREGETVILTTEDRAAHYRRKFAAIREHLGSEFNPRAISERIHILDMAGLPVRLISADRGEQFRPSPEIEELADALRRKAPNADHVIIETISRITGGVESNAAMSVLVTACERLSVLTGVAVTLVGHVGQNTARAGIADAYAGRGGSALGDNARSSMVLMPLTEKNVEEYGAGLEISDHDLEHTLVLTHPKRNGTAATESPPRLLRRLSTRFGPILNDAKYPSTGVPVMKSKKPGRKPALTYAEMRVAIIAYVKKHQPASGNAVIQDIGGNRTNARTLIADMLRERSLTRDGEGKLTLPVVGPNAGSNSQLQLDPTVTGPVGPNTPLPYGTTVGREGGVIGLTTGSDSSMDPVHRTQSNKEPF